MNTSDDKVMDAINKKMAARMIENGFETIVQIDKEKTCQFCQTKEKRYFVCLNPCNHVICINCNDSLYEQQSESCPVCKEKIIDFEYIK